MIYSVSCHSKKHHQGKMKTQNNVSVYKRMIPWSQFWQWAVSGLIEKKMGMKWCDSNVGGIPERPLPLRHFLLSSCMAERFRLWGSVLSNQGA